MSTSTGPAVNSYLFGNITQGTGLSISFPLSYGFLNNHAQSSPEVGARFCIMKGTVPTDFSTLTSFNARSADMLITFDPTRFSSSSGTSAFSPTVAGANPANISTIYINASASGTATWFWWFTTPLGSFNTFNNAVVPYHQIVGTVGLSGSGADLTIPSVNIVTGSPYRIYNYRLQIPASWTF